MMMNVGTISFLHISSAISRKVRVYRTDFMPENSPFVQACLHRRSQQAPDQTAARENPREGVAEGKDPDCIAVIDAPQIFGDGWGHS